MCRLIINCEEAVAHAEPSPQDTVLEHLLQGAAWSYAKPMPTCSFCTFIIKYPCEHDVNKTKNAPCLLKNRNAIHPEEGLLEVV